jgi:hypothetical protein
VDFRESTMNILQIHHVSSLETLSLKQASSNKAVLSNLPNLKTLELTRFYAKELSLQHIPRLEKLDNFIMVNFDGILMEDLPLQELPLKLKGSSLRLKGLPSLVSLNLDDSTLHNLTFEDSLPSVVSLSLKNTYKLENLDVSNLPALKELFVDDSEVITLTFGNNPAFEKLTATCTQQLSSIDFGQAHPKYINLDKILWNQEEPKEKACSALTMGGYFDNLLKKGGYFRASGTRAERLTLSIKPLCETTVKDLKSINNGTRTTISRFVESDSLNSKEEIGA